MAYHAIRQRFIAGPRRPARIRSQHHHIVAELKILARQCIDDHFLAAHLGKRRFGIHANAHGFLLEPSFDGCSPVLRTGAKRGLQTLPFNQFCLLTVNINMFLFLNKRLALPK